MITEASSLEFIESLKRDVSSPGLGYWRWPIINIGKIEKTPAPLSIHHFDMTLSDGRVYRVRVSDITPEKETAS